MSQRVDGSEANSFNSDHSQYHGWITIITLRARAYGDGLGKVMSGVERLPAGLASGLEPNATAAVARYSKQKREYHEKNGKLFARMMLATTGSTEGYHSPADMSFKYFPISARLSLGGGAVR